MKVYCLKKDNQAFTGRFSFGENQFDPSIPVKIKEPVVYMRTHIGGVEGGSYLDNSDHRSYINEEEKEYQFEVLDLVLKELKSDISYLDYKKIEKLIHTNKETEHYYYGNSKTWKIKYIVLSELIKELSKLQ